MKAKTDRNKQIMAYRADGRTYDWIAEKLGMTRPNVISIYYRELTRTRLAKEAEAQA